MITYNLLFISSSIFDILYKRQRYFSLFINWSFREASKLIKLVGFSFHSIAKCENDRVYHWKGMVLSNSQSSILYTNLVKVKVRDNKAWNTVFFNSFHSAVSAVCNFPQRDAGSREYYNLWTRLAKPIYRQGCYPRCSYDIIRYSSGCHHRLLFQNIASSLERWFKSQQ